MPVIYIIGDSTAENGSAPFFGWGGQLQALCRQEVTVCNFAKGGESSRSFFERGLFEFVRREIGPQDLLLAQFGHNDEKEDPERHTDPWSSFPAYMRRYADTALKAGAMAALLTPVSRRYFLPDGNLLYTHGEYPLAVRSLAARCGLPCIDLESLSRRMYLKLGQEASAELFVRIPKGENKQYPEGLEDLTHFCLEGARRIAAFVGASMAREPRLAGFIRNGAFT